MIHGAGSGRCLCVDSGGDGRRFVREGKKGNIMVIILHFIISTNLMAGTVNADPADTNEVGVQYDTRDMQRTPTQSLVVAHLDYHPIYTPTFLGQSEVDYQ